MKFEFPLWLASSSPRRCALLADAGLRVNVHPPAVDDSLLDPHETPPVQWVMAMAYFKARNVAGILHEQLEDHRGTVLGADTVCAHGTQMYGQPRDIQHARDMLKRMRNAVHQTISGVCLLDLKDSNRLLFMDQTQVTVGEVDDKQIETYLNSGQWRGKAGAYNLIERLEAGWPIQCIGDPTTVMGLPMQRLSEMFKA